MPADVFPSLTAGFVIHTADGAHHFCLERGKWKEALWVIMMCGYEVHKRPDN